MNHQRKKFIWVMRVFTIIYFVGGLLFFFMPNELFYLINIGPKVFKIAHELPIYENPHEKFWLTLAVSMMSMLCLLSYSSSKNPDQKDYILIHMIAKITSVTGFIFLFVKDHAYFGYIVGAITDSMVIMIVLFFYNQMLRSKNAN